MAHESEIHLRRDSRQESERSISFYTKLLGMKNLGRSAIEPTAREVVTLQSAESGSMLELNYYPRSSPFYTKYSVGEGLDRLAFGVPDLDTALAQAKKMGHPASRTSREDEPLGLHQGPRRHLNRALQAIVGQ